MYTDVKRNFMTYFYGDPEYYHDYKYLQDEFTVLSNPHKGWYWHYIDNGMTRCEFYQGRWHHSYCDAEDEFDITEFPGLHHLALRIDWYDIEKQEGVFDWSRIDEIFERYGKMGFKFNFRVCTYEGILHDDFGFATPEWVKDAGAEGWTESNGSWQPKYDDPIFLEKLENFMREFGGRYNNNPLVEYIDLGTIGIWGEGNAGHQIYTIDMYKKHIDMHLKYFPDKTVMINDDIINCSSYNPSVNRKHVLDYALGKGMGFRDDSILWVGNTVGNCGYDTMRTPFMFDLFAENAPVDIELDHLKQVNDDVYKDGMPIYESLKRAHATFCGFHCYPQEWVEKYPYLSKHIANKLGYWYFLNGAELPEFVSGLPAVAKFYFENKGFAKAYNCFTLKFRLVAENGKEFEIFSSDNINTNWLAEQVYKETLKFDLSDVPSGKYTLCVGLFEGDLPIKMGFKKECEMDGGFYGFDTVEVR